jgi:hypothetical protein
MPKLDVTVELVGENGNAFAILGKVRREMNRAGISKAEQDKYFEEATAGNYDHLLRTTMEWVNVR